MAVRTLYLHVGTHKTGTTSIQQGMVRDKHRYLEQGVTPYTAPSPRGRLSGHAVALSNAIIRPSVMSLNRLNDPDLRGGMQAYVQQARVMRRFARAATDRMLISSEALCFCRTAGERLRLRGLARLCKARIVPILVVRNPDDWRSSWESQLRKSKKAWRQIETAPVDTTVMGDWYYDIAAIRAFWRRIGPTIEIDYDQAVERDGSVIPSFLNAIGLDSTGFDSEIFVNSRPATPPLAEA